MQRYVNNSSHPSLVYIHRNPSLPDIETILNVLLWLHNEVQKTHYYQSCAYRICSFLKAFCNDVNDHSMQRYVNNSSHPSFVYIHRNPSLTDIETILNVLLLLKNEVQKNHHHQSSEDRNCTFPEELCKDENDHSMQRYVNNSCHPSFVYIYRNPSPPDTETILNVLLWLHNEAPSTHYHQQCEYRICSSLLALRKDVDDHSMQQYVNNSYHPSFFYIHCNPSLPDIETILNILLWLHSEAQNNHYHQSFEYRIYISLEALCKDENDHLMQLHLSNLYHSSFFYAHRNLSPPGIETILNVLMWLHNEAQKTHYLQSSGYRICSSLIAFCKDVNDHSMQPCVNNSYHPSFVYIHHNPSLPGIETILNVLLWLHNEAQNTHYHPSYEYQICSSLKALCKDENDHLMQRYVNNSYHLSFFCIHRYPSLLDIETILNVLAVLHKEEHTIHYHQSSEDQNCGSVKSFCKDVSDYLMQQYVNNSCHPSFVYTHRNPSLSGIEIILSFQSWLHNVVETSHHHCLCENQNCISPEVFCKDVNDCLLQQYVSNYFLFSLHLLHCHPCL